MRSLSICLYRFALVNSMPTQFLKSGYLYPLPLKKVGTCLKTWVHCTKQTKTNENVVLKFIFIHQLNKKDPAQVFSEWYRYKKGEKISVQHTY